MTTTYSDTSCNSENIVACSQLVARGCCMHVFLVGNNDSESLFTGVGFKSCPFQTTSFSDAKTFNVFRDAL